MIDEQQTIPYVFFGTDGLAEAVLLKLLEADLAPALIVTTPDRPAGRKRVLTSPPIKVLAEKLTLPVIQPSDLKVKDVIEKLALYGQGLFLTASYGHLIPRIILDLPRFGCLNIHPSLLPRWRGPAPLQFSILYDQQPGVSLMVMDEKMDHGPIIEQKTLELKAWPVDYFKLEQFAAEAGAELLLNHLSAWLKGEIGPRPQDHSQATYSKMIKKTDGELLPADPDEFNYRKILAFQKWPRAFFFIPDKLSQHQETNEPDWKTLARQAQLLPSERTRRIIVTEAELIDGRLNPLTVIPANSKPMKWSDLLHGLNQNPK